MDSIGSVLVTLYMLSITDHVRESRAFVLPTLDNYFIDEFKEKYYCKKGESVSRDFRRIGNTNWPIRKK